MEDPCSICGIMVNRKNKTRHMKLHSEVKFVCKNCDKPFSRSDVLKRHEKMHGPSKYNCIPCEKSFQSRDQIISWFCIKMLQNHENKMNCR